MVHIKYTYKDGKKFGPYYYETKRIDGKIITTYLGTELPVRERNNSKKYFLAFFALLIIAIFSFIFYNFYTLTGHASLNLKTDYVFGEPIEGVFILNLKSGEFIPSDSNLIVSYGDNKQTLALSSVISSDLQEGDYYAEDTSISGYGLGYGSLGTVNIYPELSFQLRLVEQDVLDSPSDNSTSESSSDGPSDSGSSGSPSDSNASESPSESSSEPVESSDNSNSQIDSGLEIPSETPSDSSSSDSPSDTSTSESSSDGPSDSGSSDSAGITGSAIEDGSVIFGTVSGSNEFRTNLFSGQTAEIIPGSVLYNGDVISDDFISLEIVNGEAVVSSTYSIVSEGYGKEYLGDYSEELSMDLSQFGLIADLEAPFSIELVYQDVSIVSSSEDISVSRPTIQPDIPLAPQEIILEINESDVNVNVTQFDAVIGQPVKWNKRVSFDLNSSVNLFVQIPANAQDVIIEKIDATDYAEENGLTLEEVISGSSTSVESETIESNYSANLSENNLPVNEDNSSSNESTFGLDEAVPSSEEVVTELTVGVTGKVISGHVTADIALSKEPKFFKSIKKLFGVTGRVVDSNEESVSEVQELSINVSEEEFGVELQYVTDAPTAIEEDFGDRKIIYVSGPDDVHYSNVLVFTNLSDSLEITDSSNIVIEWVENISQIISIYNVSDTNGDGNYDYVSWIAPHLSNQTFNLILVEKAKHLDSEYNRIADIFEEVVSLDGNWTNEINDTQIVRVTFAQNLNSGNDITLYLNITSGAPIINVYEKDENLTLATFDNLTNSVLQKIYLTNLSSEQKTFDLQIIGGSVIFDYIVDPIINIGGPYGDIALSPLDNETFAIVFVNISASQIQYQVLNTNGTARINSVAIGTSQVNSNFSRVSITSTNSTQTFIGFINGTVDNRVIYDISGAKLTQVFGGDNALGANVHDVGVSAMGLNGRVLYCYVDLTEGDSDVRSFWFNGSVSWTGGTGELDANPAMAPVSPLNQLSDCVAINTTTGFVFEYDAGTDDDATFHVVAMNSTFGLNERITDTDIDAAVGNFGQVSITSLNQNSTAMVWSNTTALRFAIRSGLNSVIKAPTDIDRRTTGTVRFATTTVNNLTLRDHFVVAWYNGTNGGLLATAFDDGGNVVTPTFQIDNSFGTSNATALFDIVGEEDATGLSICPGKWAIVYTNSTNSTVIKTYDLAGSTWNGVCGTNSGIDDGVAPVVILKDPANNSVTTGSVLTFKADFTDNVNVSTATLYIYNTSNGVADKLIGTNTTLLGNASISANISYTLNYTGIFYWNFLAVDNSSNQAFNSTNQTIRYVAQYQINGTIPLASGGFMNTTFAIYSYSSNYSVCNVTGNGSSCGVNAGEHSWANITFNNRSEQIKNIVIYGINATSTVSSLLEIDNNPNRTNFDTLFAINPVFQNFTGADITFTATSTTFLKCPSWNFTSRVCPGKWEIALSGLTIGNNYTFFMNATDPGYAQINITNATHLDSNYNYISDVYPNVSALDDNWSEIINHTDYIRVIFERNLTNTNDITVYTRSVQNRNMTVWVYPYNSSNKIAEFPILNETGLTQVILSDLVDTNYIFDLKVIDIDNNTDSYLEFDYITDPTYNFTESFSPDIDMSPVDNETFAVIYTDASCDCVKFTVQNTNGTVRLAPVTVASGVNVNVSRVGIETVNDTSFFLAWTTAAGLDMRAGYTIAGGVYISAASGDGAIGAINHDISLAMFGGSDPKVAYCYIDHTESDSDLRIYNASNGTIIAGETDINTALSPETSLNSLIECAAAGNTNATFFEYDAGTDDDATFHQITFQGIESIGDTDLDSSVGNKAQVAVTALNNDRYFYAVYDFESDRMRHSLRGINNDNIFTIADTHNLVGNNSRIALATVADRASGGRDNVVLVWYNGTGNYTALSVFDENGTKRLSSRQLTSLDTNLRLLSVLGESDSQNRSICPGKFVVALTNSSNSTIFSTYNLDGTNWDGTCTVTSPIVNITAPLNNSGVRYSSNILNFTADDPMNNSLYVRVFAGTDPNTTNYDMMLYYANVSDPAKHLTYNWTSKPVNRSDSGLFLLYRFDNNPMFGENRSLVKDFSPSGLDGSIQTPTDDRSPHGHFGGALTAFTGTNDISLPDSVITNSPNATGQFTIMFWINLTTTNFTRAFEFIAVKSLTTNDRAYGIYFRNSSKTIHASFGNGVTMAGFEGSNNSLLKQFVWHHVAVTVDRLSQNATMYINGEVNASVLLSTLGGNALMNSTSSLLIGDIRGVNGEPTYIDELALYNRTLSANEIRDHYRLRNGTYFWKVNVTNDDLGQNETAVYKFSVDSHVPHNVTLNYPTNGLNFFAGSSVSFNWTVEDYVDLNLGCNLTIDSIVNASWVNITNASIVNWSVTGFSVGAHQTNVTCWDDAFNFNVSEMTTFNVIALPSNNPPYNLSQLVLNTSSSLAMNRTFEDLTLSANISDPEASRMNLTIYWYKNNVLNSVVHDLGNYSNGTIFYKLLSETNTAKNEQWKAGIVITDGVVNSSQINTTILTIENTPPTVSSFEISPQALTAVSYVDIEAMGTLQDDDGDNPLYVNFTWIKNNVTVLYSRISEYNPDMPFELEFLGEGNTSVLDVIYLNLTVSQEDGPSTNLTTEAPLLIINTLSSNNTIIYLNSSTGANGTQQDLHINTTLVDLDLNRMNVTVFWFNNSVLHLTLPYNYDYVNGSLFNATLGKGNLTSTSSWIAGLVLTDSFNVTKQVNSTSLSILDDVAPTVLLNVPPNASTTATSQVWFTAQLLDDVNVSNATLYIYNTSNGLADKLIGTNFTGVGNSSRAINISYNLNYTGVFYWNFLATDNATLANNNAFNRTNFTLTYNVNSVPYNLSQLVLNTSLAGSLNMSIENLTLWTNIADPDGDRMNVTIYWYNGTNLAFVEHNKTNYANGTRFFGFALYTNITKGEQWKAGIVITDGVGNSTQINSTNITIENTPPFVTYVGLPQDGNISTDRTPYFNWSAIDIDGDLFSIGLNLTPIGGVTPCNDPFYTGSESNVFYVGGSRSAVSIEPALKCLIDRGYSYNWSIRANDSSTFGWQPYRNLSVQAYLSITATTSQVNFSTINLYQWNDTSDNSPLPLVLRNDGNAYTNISLEGQALWQSIFTRSINYQFKADNVTATGENASFTASQTPVVYTDVPIGSVELCVAELNYVDTSDSVEIDINVTVPTDEPYGTRGSVITFYGELGE